MAKQTHEIAQRPVASGTFIGDGTDNRQIPVGFKCSMVILGGYHQAGMMPGAAWCFPIPTVLAVSGLHATDGFIVDKGTDNINTNTQTYYYWAIEE